MHEAELAVDVEVRQLVEELLVGGRNADGARFVGVGGERRASAVVYEAADEALARSVEELAQHPLVVAGQRDDMAVVLQLEDRLDDPARARTSIDEVAQEDH